MREAASPCEYKGHNVDDNLLIDRFLAVPRRAVNQSETRRIKMAPHSGHNTVMEFGRVVVHTTLDEAAILQRNLSKMIRRLRAALVWRECDVLVVPEYPTVMTRPNWWQLRPRQLVRRRCSKWWR